MLGQGKREKNFWLIATATTEFIIMVFSIYEHSFCLFFNTVFFFHVDLFKSIFYSHLLGGATSMCAVCGTVRPVSSNILTSFGAKNIIFCDIFFPFIVCNSSILPF